MFSQIPFSATAAGTDSGATATHAADTNLTHVVTSSSGHTDADSLIQIKDGSPIVWESKIDVSVEGFSFSFPGLCVPCSKNATANGLVVTSSADGQVNISGYSI